MLIPKTSKSQIPHTYLSNLEVQSTVLLRIPPSASLILEYCKVFFSAQSNLRH